MSVPAHPLPITAEAMQAVLRERLAPDHLEVIDESHQHAGHVGANGTGFGTHFRVRIASPLFQGKPRVARHRLVYDALQEFIDQGAHAIAIEVL
ncbi:bolA-like family protein [Delftia acidovorans]|uniref:BolA family protein n=1 Tax=Delftia TaxID=80865 RepID=UPI000500E9AF|nr:MULTISPECIES: BolA family protein [Delftia]KFJ10182.1 bolA-like family protein [Delftia acidovorans]MCA1067054.1 DNA-binding transcriptional regulator BolA [Delftia acidovorans]MCG8985615.1 BolA family transcriptional regulator [Delftia acidovorans]OWG18959.1 BolA family transcriptional regulator [Delftia sp. K82]QQB52635.1 BolA family transcriptional regulator [Delftia acidovorans]